MPLLRSQPFPLPPNLRRFRLLLLSAIVFVSFTGLLSIPVMRAGTQAPEPALPSPKISRTDPTATPTASPYPLSPFPSSRDLAPPFDSGALVFAAAEGHETHLFLFQPDRLPFTRLTTGPWNDITPVFSPDGRSLAFASNRQGGYDLYLWSLESGEVTRLTSNAGYEASPTWSPDGRWLAYESYSLKGGSLDIWILPIDGSQPSIQLTDDPAADHSPAWSQQGRRIAFVSNRSGEDEIWLADLDNAGERFSNASASPDTGESHPAWSPDGSRLAWSSTGEEGVPVIKVWDGLQAMEVGSGSWPSWSSDGRQLFTGLATPNQGYLTGYDLEQPSLSLPPLVLPGALAGLSGLPPSIVEEWVGLGEAAAQVTPPPVWQAALTPGEDLPAGRTRLSTLDGVKAPYPLLQDSVDEAFHALRERAAYEAGWDFLATLENAFVPLTSALAPGMDEDWLYTGRAFTFNSLPLNAGWVVVVREEIGSQTFWRVYVKARFEDGSQGAPLKSLPWNFLARYQGNPRVYEQGGALASEIPAGYWIDFTALANAYGWERLPALVTWRSAVTQARYNEFVLDGGLSWHTAMLEIYPEQALFTPTALPSPTLYATATRWPTRTPRPTRTPWPSRTPTPSHTPLPSVSVGP